MRTIGLKGAVSYTIPFKLSITKYYANKSPRRLRRALLKVPPILIVTAPKEYPLMSP
jgi:hypothetical protein